MSNTITKTSLRGFTLIELLVVIAIIGLLSTAIMGPVQTGLKKGRDTRKISDVTQVQGALLQYAGDSDGKYPSALTALDPTYMKADANMLTTSQARDRYMYVSYADAAGNIVEYHLGVALENQNASLQGDADCAMKDGIAVGSPIGSVTTDWGEINGDVLVTTPVSNPCTTVASSTLSPAIIGYLLNSNFTLKGAGNNGNSDTGATASTTDFGGKGTQEDLGQVCTAKLDTCIFDIIPR